MIRRHVTALHLAYMSADALLAALLFLILSLARFGSGWRDVWLVAGLDGALAAAGYGLAWTATVWLLGLYRLRARWSVRTEAFDIARAAVFLALAVFAVLFLFKLPNVSRLFLLLLFPAQAGLTLGSRLVTRVLFAALRARGYNSRFVLVVGTGRDAAAFADRVERHAELGLRVVGHLSVDRRRARVGRRPVLGDVGDIEQVLHSRVIDEVALCLPSGSSRLLEPIARLCEDEGKIVRIPVPDGGLVLPGGRIEEFDGIQVLSLVYGPDRVLGLAFKRLLDVAGAGIGLVVLSPLLAAIALLIRVVDGSVVLFRQTRVGLHGRPFSVLKFRTMVPDAEVQLPELQAQNEIKGHAFKITDDPRLSRTGRWLRRTSLDELPQLWNVLRGEMSLVGPRPPLPREVSGYDIWHRRRLSMKPGITGLWQVSARREKDFDRWVEIDLSYIDRWSLWLDLKIILRTIPAVLTSQGR